MKKLFTLISIVAFSQYLLAQTINGFNYQAVIRNSNGEIIANELVQVRVSLLQDAETGSIVYSEDHDVTTNNFGLVNLVIGQGTVISGDFSTIDWGSSSYFLKLELNLNGGGFNELGTTVLHAVPYAMHAETVTNTDDADADPNNEIQDLSLSGNTLSLTKSAQTVTIPTPGWGNLTDDALFAVVNANGDTVFAVFQEGVRIYVSETATKSARGGFAVAGINSTGKGTATEFLRVTPDSVRIYVDESVTKAQRGGFAVAGINSSGKGTASDLFRVTPDSVRVYIDESTTQTTGGSFAVASRNATKTAGANILSVKPESTSVFINDPTQGFNVVNTGNAQNENLMRLTEENYFIGHDIAPNLTTATKNSIFGYKAGNKITSGGNNVLIGNEAGININSGHENICIGNYAGHNITWQTRNVCIGDSAGRDNTSGQYNVYLGSFAGRRVTTGTYNVVLGGSAASDSDFGSSNVVIGYAAGRLMESSNNVFIGNGAGYNNTGSVGGNVFIGYYAGEEYNTQDNTLAIAGSTRSWAPLIYGEFDNKLVKINGNLGIGTSEFGNGTNTLSLYTGVVPSASITNGVQLYAEGASAELKVRDEFGNITTLSPHNFSLTKKSEPMAWSFYSKNSELNQEINVDMLKAIRVIESLSGEKLVFINNLKNNNQFKSEKQSLSLVELFKQQQQTIDTLLKENARQEALIKEILECIKQLEP